MSCSLKVGLSATVVYVARNARLLLMKYSFQAGAVHGWRASQSAFLIQ
jgi:hypothetical protein